MAQPIGRQSYLTYDPRALRRLTWLWALRSIMSKPAGSSLLTFNPEQRAERTAGRHVAGVLTRAEGLQGGPTCPWRHQRSCPRFEREIKKMMRRFLLVEYTVYIFLGELWVIFRHRRCDFKSSCSDCWTLSTYWVKITRQKFRAVCLSDFLYCCQLHLATWVTTACRLVAFCEAPLDASLILFFSYFAHVRWLVFYQSKLNKD